MKLTICGAARQVTGSMHLLELQDGFRILVDCGLDYEKEKNTAGFRNKYFPFDIDSINLIVLTHAHIDHSGNLPNLVKQGYQGQILCTPPTYDLCSYLLMDSVQVQLKEANKKNQSHGKRNKARATKASDILYGNKDVQDTLDKMVTFEFDKEVEIHPGVIMRFVQAGHLLGAASILFRVNENGIEKKIGFSGDIGRRNSNLVVDTQSMGDLDYLVCESTYGGKTHTVKLSPEDELMQYVESTIIKFNGRLVIPAFSVGRTQAIIYSLHKLYLAGRLPHVKIFVDSPLAIESTEIYSKYISYLNEDAKEFNKEHKGIFHFDLVTEVENMKQSEGISTFGEPCIIVSAAGMVEGGRIIEHIINNIQNPYSTILIAGYCAEGTLGWNLKQKNAYLTIRGKSLPVHASVASTDVFSSHPDHTQLVEYVKSYDKKKLKNIFLVHGEEYSLNAFREALIHEGYTGATIAEYEWEYEL